MRRWVVVLSAFTVGCAAATTVAGAAVAGQGADPYTASGGMAGIVYAHGASNGARPTGGGGGSPDLIYHSGPVNAVTTVVEPIFWGTSWSSPSIVGDKISGLDTFYTGIGGSNYIKTNTEYTNSSGQRVSSSVSKLGDLLDPSAAISHAPQTSDIFNEVIRATGGNVQAGAFYPVYVDTPRKHANYCAWHSSGTYNGKTFQFGFFFNLDGDPGCDPGDTSTSHSQGLAALANVSGHELSETVTDPQLNAWYDSSGYENADKCAWTFNGTESFGGSTWYIQGNWSNAAYDNGKTGYANGGCINGN